MPNAPAYHPSRERRRRSRSEISRLEDERDAWLASLAPLSLFHRMFDHLPGVYFFAKDRRGRTMFCSRGILSRYAMNDEREMLGLTDFDLNPGSMAEGYISDDESLLTGKAERIERLELWFDSEGMPDWFVVTKLPLIDRRQRVVGVMGVLRRTAEHEMKLPVYQTVSRAVELIRRDYAKPLSVQDIATRCGQSLRNLQRQFQSAFGISPQEFLMKTRVLAAIRLLEETNLTAAEIASRCGFVDASSFAEHFRKRTGVSPTTYRRRE